MVSSDLSMGIFLSQCINKKAILILRYLSSSKFNETSCKSIYLTHLPFSNMIKIGGEIDIVQSHLIFSGKLLK